MDCIKCNSSQVRVIDTRAKGTRRYTAAASA
jgi:hypothetical protein